MPLLEDLSTRYTKINSEYAVTKRFVKVKFADFTQTTLEEMIEREDQKPDGHFRDMLIKAWQRGNKPVRLLGIGVRLLDLRSSGHMKQLELFERKSGRL